MASGGRLSRNGRAWRDCSGFCRYIRLHKPITTRLGQIEKVLDKLYEDNALGAIEQDRYEQMSQKYSEEYYTLKTEFAEPTEQEIRQMREEIEEAKKEKSRAYHRNYARLSQRRDERQDHNPDKGMENRVCQTDRREENTQPAVSCIERGSERSRENQKERLQYLVAGTAGAITDRAAGLSTSAPPPCFGVLLDR